MGARMGPPGSACTFLVRYGEIGIKSPPVRRRFEGLLAENLLRHLKARAAEGRVEHTWGRLFLHAPEAQGRQALAHAFGVVSFSPARRAPRALEELAAFVAQAAERIPDKASFGVRARRSGEPGYTSQDVARAVGASVLAHHGERGVHVNLDEPDVEVLIEVRDGDAWLAFETAPGPGGLPVGSEGRVSAWLASPRDAIAAWLAMKRGCRVHLLAPSGAGAELLARALAAWDPGVELTEVQAPGEHRALALALLEAHARRRKGQAVVVGDRFEEALALAGLDRAIALPVFRPLLALEGGMLAELAGRVGVVLDADAPPSPPSGPQGDFQPQVAGLLRAARRTKVMP